MNERFRVEVDEAPAPDAAEEYLLYQTLVASWPMKGFDSEPDYGQRIAAYMTKARHEAKRSTSYINPNTAYEEAAEAFVKQVLDAGTNRPFLEKVEAFVATIKAAGICNSLTQLVLKLATPGIPDFFQGRELWDFSLVDPDNRRLIDYHDRPILLESLRAEVEQRGGAAVEAWFLSPEDGKIKMWITAAGLGLRRARPALFHQNGYEPLLCRGPKAKHLFAFARRKGNQAAVVLVTRHVAALGDRPLGTAWAETTVELPVELQGAALFDVLTARNVAVDGRSLSVEATFRHLPMALLETPK
jgi:(1->4)-alpha-D-glucan 1-alpha-D-glucosylmutase